MMYRDETETLREELRQTSAELARVNAELAKRDAEPEEVEVIPYRDALDELRPWVEGTLMALLCGFALFAALGIMAEVYAYRRLALLGLGMAGVDLFALAWLWWRALPRVKVKR